MSNLRTFLEAGIVHADLSPYNVLWWDERLWFIDFPQAVDLVANPHGFELLHHDVTTMCTWFTRRGLACDADALYAELLATAF
jgi:RIO kinase 1